MRFIRALLLALASLSGMLAGCGNPAPPTPKGTEEELREGLKAEREAADNSEKGTFEFNEPLPDSGEAIEEIDDG